MLGLVTSIGLNWAAAILIGLFGGRWVDGRLHTGPLFLLLGLLLGMAAGFWGSLKLLKVFFQP